MAAGDDDDKLPDPADLPNIADLPSLDDFEDLDDFEHLDLGDYRDDSWSSEALGPVRSSLPPRWSELIRVVSRARAVNLANPNHPLVEIGRFGAIVPRGRGGCGLVFEVHDPQLDRRVALKLCLRSGPAAEAAIMHEARVLAKLSHPNIIAVHETGRHGDDVFFVMDLVEGRRNSGYDLINKQPRWQDAVNIYVAAGSGLAAAHDANIIHGDFKPGNVLIDQLCERPRVADFGFARILLEHTPASEREQVKFKIGTLPYMAPEVLRGQPGDQLSDQWSFCVSLWETLEGRRPYRGYSAGLLLESIALGEPWAIQPEDKVPTALRAVLRVGLSLDPRNRHADMHTLVRRLRELTQPAQVLVVPPTPPPRRRRRLLAGPDDVPRPGIFFLAMFLAFTVLLGSITSAMFWARQDSARARAEATAVQPAPAPTPAPLAPAPDLEGERALGRVLGLIEAGDYVAADAKWEAEVRRRDSLHRSSVDGSMLVALA
ncbi:serine/threonine-protein kinase, partial [Enhygromyxa salina]|uniref:serine/threonine-protein kinase n=1 Tax=Enhygromyxa salina TaxID=215803 RepID=UPI0013FCFF11